MKIAMALRARSSTIMTDLHTKVEKYQTNAAQCEASAGPLLANSPSGKSANLCPAPIRKIFRLTRRANHLYRFARLARKRGGSRSSRTWGGMRWTRRRRRAEVIAGRVSRERSSGTQTNDAGRGRRSRVVLTPRRWCQVFERCSRPTGFDASLTRRRRWQKSPVTGRAIACSGAYRRGNCRPRRRV
jgi:hypothetical protein